jgi:seryl-tRNA synthetase
MSSIVRRANWMLFAVLLFVVLFAWCYFYSGLTCCFGGGLLGETNPFFGRSHTEESKKKMRDKQIGVKHSEENKKKIGEGVKNSQKYKDGIKKRKNRTKKEKILKTLEEKHKNRSNSIKKWIKENPEAHKERMDKINKNPIKIAKMVEKQIGRPQTEERKANISKALIGKRKGSENPEFKGYYITPYGIFDSLEQASLSIGNSKICIRDRCRILNEKTVKLFSHLKDSKITKDMVGKTWKELGWGFEDA